MPWTSVARLVMLRATVGDGIFTPPSLFLALTTSDPTPDGAVSEVADVAYRRQAAEFTLDPANNWFYLAYDLTFGPMAAAGSFRGLQLINGASASINDGSCWFYDDYGSSGTVPWTAGKVITFPAGSLLIPA